MKKILLTALPLLFLFAFSACNPDEEEVPDTAEVREQIEGSWNVDEQESLISKDMKIFYQVYIDIDTSSSDRIFITNFYQLGLDVFAIGKVNGSTIRIDPQEIGSGYFVEGTGSVSSNYRSINLEYTVDPGDGMLKVTSLWEKQQ